MPRTKTIKKSDSNTVIQTSIYAGCGMFCKLQVSEVLSMCPNFCKTGSIRGMKKLYYGNNALLVRFGGYVYNVTAYPEIYNLAH